MSKPISFGKLEMNLTAGEENPAGLPDSDTPFRILVLGDFSGRANRGLSDSTRSLADQKPVLIDRDNFDEAMANLNVELHLPIRDENSPDIAINFDELDGFHPDRIFERVEIFQSLRQTRERLSDPATFQEAAAEVKSWARVEETKQEPDEDPSRISADFLLERIIGDAQSQPQKARAPQEPGDWNALLQDIVRPHIVPGDDPQQAQLIGYVDAAISGLMRKILRHPDFQAIESAWRAAFFLARRLETGTDLKLYLLDISKAELRADLSSTDDLTSICIYKLLVEQTVGTLGGESWAVVAGNFSFDRSREDVEMLGRIARIARQASAPFIAAASPRILGCESLAETPDPDDWSPSYDTENREDWQHLGELPESSYLGLALPRFLLRLPYGEATDPIEQFEFEEMDGEPEHEDYLWGNPAFACACLLGQTFSHYGWDFSDGTLHDIDDLPLHVYEKQGEPEIKPCAEALLTERAAEIIMSNGLMPLLSFKGRDVVRLARFQSLASQAKPLAGRWS